MKVRLGLPRGLRSLGLHARHSLMLVMAIVCFFLTTIPICSATPPTSITLTYDLDKGLLHVKAIHPSFNLDKSYVRLMNVYLNGAQVKQLNYFRQEDYNEFTEDVPVTAQEGDVLKVELFCSLGGDMSRELTVKKPDATPPEKNADSSGK